VVHVVPSRETWKLNVTVPLVLPAPVPVTTFDSTPNPVTAFGMNAWLVQVTVPLAATLFVLVVSTVCEVGQPWPLPASAAGLNELTTPSVINNEKRAPMQRPVLLKNFFIVCFLVCGTRHSQPRPAMWIVPAYVNAPTAALLVTTGSVVQSIFRTWSRWSSVV